MHNTCSNNYFEKFFYESNPRQRLCLSMDVVTLERELFFSDNVSIRQRKNFLFTHAQHLNQLFDRKQFIRRFLFSKKFNFIQLNYLFFSHFMIWGLFSYDKFTAKQLSKGDSKILSRDCRKLVIRNFFRRLHLIYSRSNQLPAIKSRSRNIFLLRYRKNLLKKTSYLSYQKYFDRIAFNQRSLMVFFFEHRFLNRFFFLKKRQVRHCINFFISKNNLLTLKSLGFYRRTVAAKRYKRRR